MQLVMLCLSLRVYRYSHMNYTTLSHNSTCLDLVVILMHSVEQCIQTKNENCDKGILYFMHAKFLILP